MDSLNEKKEPVFCTLFTRTENFHLLKDVGLIPYCLKKYFGYDAYIATFENGEYPYLESKVQGLRLDFVKKCALGKIASGMSYILKHRKDIDVLNVYHLNLSSFVWIKLFNLVKKKGAVSYLKLDADYREIERVSGHGPVAMIKRATIKSAGIVSAESTWMRDEMQKYAKSGVLYLPDGYMPGEYDLLWHQDECAGGAANDADDANKENYILTVGRLGTEQKNTELLVDAFLQANISDNWNLLLVGGMEDGFKEWLLDKLSKFPDKKDRVFYTGALEDREDILKCYMRSKIFVLPSRWESFGIVLLEALLGGCYCIVTDVVPPAGDLIKSPVSGTTIESESLQGLIEALEEATAFDMDWEDAAKRISRSVRDEFSWKNILRTLDDAIKEI